MPSHSDAHYPANPVRHPLIAAAVFLVGVLGTAAIAYVAGKATQSKDAERFAAAVQRVQLDIDEKIRDYAGVMEAVASFVAMRGMGNADLDAFISTLAHGTRLPVSRLRYLQSTESASSPNARAAILHARDSGTIAISDITGPSNSKIVTLYLPVYASGVAVPAADARRDEFTGCVIAEIRLREFLEGVFGTEPDPRVAFALFDGEPAAETMAYSAPGYDLTGARFAATRTIERGGHTWRLSIHSSPGLDLISSRGLVPQIFVAGFFLSVLLAALTALEASARRRAQELLASEREALAEAERMGRVKDEFLATLSHELRTPLNAIIGWVHMMRELQLPQHTQAKALETVERNAQIQAQLIGDLLDMSRIAAGKGRLELRPVDIAEVIDTALNVVRPSVSDQNLQLHARVAANLPLINGDPQRLQQVLCNLLTNAIKFTPGGGQIEVDAQAAGEGVRLSVADTGVGIDKEFLPHVFERFRQADASTTRAHGGLGLGLSIAKSLVEMHGGTIRAESAGRHRGATFIIHLPAASAVSPIRAAV